MKHIWKMLLAMAVMMMIACPNTNTEEEDKGGDTDIYISGLSGNNWAGDSDAGSADKMTQDGDVYTFKFTPEADGKSFPYGFKFSSSKGWNEQYINSAYKTTTTQEIPNFVITAGTSYDVTTSSKAELEKKDEDGNALYQDDATKFYFEKECKAGIEYTITFDKAAMKVTLTGTEWGSNIVYDNKLSAMMGITSGYGNADIVWNDVKTRGTAEITYSLDTATWGQTELGDLEFGVTLTAGGWDVKYVGAVIEALGKAYDLTLAGTDNNKVGADLLSAGKTYVFTVDVITNTTGTVTVTEK